MGSSGRPGCAEPAEGVGSSLREVYCGVGRVNKGGEMREAKKKCRGTGGSSFHLGRGKRVALKGRGRTGDNGLRGAKQC